MTTPESVPFFTRGPDAEFIDGLQGLSEEDLEDTIGEAVAFASEGLVDHLRQEMPEVLAANREYRAGFESRLRSRWQSALDLFEMLMLACQEAGQAFNAAYRAEAAKTDDYVFEVLSRLHARACLTASEVLALLTSGHADGANVRWRTLHELAVVAFFVKEHGNDVAERYLLHDAIQAAKGAEQYVLYEQRLNLDPLPEQELEAHRARRVALIARFGKPFASDFGWAASALNIDRPTFAELEMSVQMDHHRPYYRMASNSVHPNARGIYFSLAAKQGPIMLAGPSDGGLADPGHSTLLSLYSCTVALLNLRPGLEQLTLLQSLQTLVDEAGEAFLAAHQQWERERDEYMRKGSATDSVMGED